MHTIVRIPYWSKRLDTIIPVLSVMLVFAGLLAPFFAVPHHAASHRVSQPMLLAPTPQADASRDDPNSDQTRRPR